MFRLFRLCRKEEISRKTSFDVLPNCNNVEATFDFVERIVRLVALDNVASTYFCWRGWGLIAVHILYYVQGVGKEYRFGYIVVYGEWGS